VKLGKQAGKSWYEHVWKGMESMLITASVYNTYRPQGVFF